MKKPRRKAWQSKGSLGQSTTREHTGVFVITVPFGIDGRLDLRLGQVRASSLSESLQAKTKTVKDGRLLGLLAIFSTAVLRSLGFDEKTSTSRTRSSAARSQKWLRKTGKPRLRVVRPA